MKERIVGVVGGGPAGMTAAIAAARCGCRVMIFERNDRIGKKLLSTGNGKCNLGNRMLSEQEYGGSSPKWIRESLSRFGTEDTICFFQGLGLLIKERNGYLYLACEQASAVLDVLRAELKALGVRILTGCLIDKIGKDRSTGKIQVCAGKDTYFLDRVVLACGGKAAPRTGSDGAGYRLAENLRHSLRPVVPALVQLRCREDCLKAVAGVRAEALVRAVADGKTIAAERGEVQLTDYGISGIPVFQMSRTVNYCLREQREVTVILDFLPDYSSEEYAGMQKAREMMQPDRTVEEFFTGILHKKLMMLFIKTAGLKPNEPVDQAKKRALNQVFALCRKWELHVTGSNSFDHAQVSAGGVDTDQVTEKMESKLVPGVYFAGEILDVDGKCGGYNLQWAWCSGYLAGDAAGRGT